MHLRNLLKKVDQIINKCDFTAEVSIVREKRIEKRMGTLTVFHKQHLEITF